MRPKSFNLQTMSSWLERERGDFFLVFSHSLSPSLFHSIFSFSYNHRYDHAPPPPNSPHDDLILVPFTLSEVRTKQPSSVFYSGQRWSWLIDSSHLSFSWIVLSGAWKGVTPYTVWVPPPAAAQASVLSLSHSLTHTVFFSLTLSHTCAHRYTG